VRVLVGGALGVRAELLEVVALVEALADDRRGQLVVPVGSGEELS